MAIISISLNEKNLEDLDQIQKDLGFSGRSEAVRTALRMLVAERNERKRLSGRVEGVLVIVNEMHQSEGIDEVYHEHQDLIRTHIHDHTGKDTCMNVLIMGGEAEELNLVLDQLEKMDGVRYMKFIRS